MLFDTEPFFSLSPSVCAIQKAHTGTPALTYHLVRVLWLEIYKQLRLPGAGLVDAGHYRVSVKVKVDYHFLRVFLPLNFVIIPVLLMIVVRIKIGMFTE